MPVPDRTETRVPELTETLEQKLSRLEAENTELKEKLASAEARAITAETRAEIAETKSETDALTELGNRRAIERKMRDTVAEVKRGLYRAVVLFIDVDKFKEVNDLYGHEQGDNVLRQIADLFRQLGRKSDFFGRYGGDEYVAILATSEEVEFDKIKLALAKYNERAQEINRSGDPSNVDAQTLSIGGVLIDSQVKDSWQTVLKAADKNVYLSKRRGRNQLTLTGYPPPTQSV